MGKQSRGKQDYRRRKGNDSWLWLVGIFVVGFIALWGWSGYARPERQLPGLQTLPDEGREHVATGSPIAYKSDPPTSGFHYPNVTESGFYTTPQPEGSLVHALEHGRIVIYYDPDDTPAHVVERLKGYASQYTGEWDGVVVTPRSQEEEVILTAWRKMLRLPKWSQEQAEKFMDAFRGRGPENPVR